MAVKCVTWQGENMGIIEYLDNVKKYDTAVKDLERRKMEVTALAEKITAGEIDGMPHGSEVSDKVGSGAAQLADIEKELQERIKQYVEYKNEVCNYLIQLPTIHYQVLYALHINYLSVNEIADQLHFSRQHIWRIKLDAYTRLAQIVYMDRRKKCLENRDV